MSDPAKPKTKPLQIDPEIHRLLKRLSADESRSMAAIAEEKLWELFPAERAAHEHAAEPALA